MGSVLCARFLSCIVRLGRVGIGILCQFSQDILLDFFFECGLEAEGIVRGRTLRLGPCPWIVVDIARIAVEQRHLAKTARAKTSGQLAGTRINIDCVQNRLSRCNAATNQYFTAEVCLHRRIRGISVQLRVFVQFIDFLHTVTWRLFAFGFSFAPVG